MHTALPSNIDKREFLAWGERHEGRYELVRGNAVMTPPSMRVHALTRMSLFSLISARLDGAKWEIFPNFGVDTGPKSLVSPVSNRPRRLQPPSRHLIAHVERAAPASSTGRTNWNRAPLLPSDDAESLPP
jgi:hypothetical protein